jgi:RNA polymerase sigma-70 factor (ECF subfamily)
LDVRESEKTGDVTLAAIRAGDRTAFEGLVNESWDPLVAHLTWVLGSQEAAEDAGQEAFIRLWEQRERWHDGSARALVFRIGRNLAFDEKRKERVRRDFAAREAEAAGRAECAEDRAEIMEYETRFREALEALTPSRREAIELVRLRGLSHQEAADALEISKQTVANRMTLALADLRLLLADILPDLCAGRPSDHAREIRDG